MKRSAKFGFAILFVLSLNYTVQGQDDEHGEVKDKVCSSYTFYKKHYSWEIARDQCSNIIENRGLVSMESKEEWEYLKKVVNNRTKSFEGSHWYIGLKKSSQKWCWLSDTSACVNDTSPTPGKWRWNHGEPNNPKTEHCVEMLNDGTYNNIQCSTRFSHIGYICEKRLVSREASGPYIFCLQKTSTTTTKPSSKSGIQTTSTKQSTVKPYTSTIGTTSPKTTSTSSTQEAILPVYHPNDDSSRGNQSPSITVIVVAVLAAMLVILLLVLGCVLWRRRLSSSKGEEDQMVNHAVDRIRLESVPEQTPHDRTQPEQNYTPLQEDKKEEDPHLYAVVKKRNKAAHRSSGTSTAQQQVPDDDEKICVTSNLPSEPSLKKKDHIYANANQADPQKKPRPVYPTPYALTQKRPTEHTDDGNGREQYLYAAVDKTRKRNKKDEPSTCGPVYAELGFNPLQDDDDTEMTTQDSFTVYASIQEGQ